MIYRHIKKMASRKPRRDLKASIYELNAEGYLAILLNLINLDDLLRQVDEATALTILRNITQTQFYAASLRP